MGSTRPPRRLPGTDLRAEDGASERSSEDRSDPRADPDRHGDPRVRRCEIEPAREHRTEASADLCRRSFAASRPSRTDRDRRGDDLHERHPCPDASRIVVDRCDSGIGAVTFGFGCQAEHEDAGDQTSEPDNQRQGPRPDEVRSGAQRGTLTCRRRGRVSTGQAQEELGRPSEGCSERDGAEPSDDPDDHAKDEPFPQVPSLSQPGGRLREDPISLHPATDTVMVRGCLPGSRRVPS